MRIALNQVGNSKWHGGITYLHNLLCAIRSLPVNDQPELFLHIDQNTAPHLQDNASLFPLLDGITYRGPIPLQETSVSGLPLKSYTSSDLFFEDIDFLFPLNTDVLPGVPVASWIPDFQHKYLPHLFSQELLSSRDTLYQKMADEATVVVLSSEAVKKDYINLYSSNAAPVEILRFHTSIPKDALEMSPQTIVNKYELPDNYILCCNQFWAHKNHSMLFETLALLKKQGHSPTLVCTGGTEDFRDKNYFTNLTNSDAFNAVKENVKILGFIPREDQIQLLRSATALIQPSLFEGWSTVVEDARSVGLPLFLSNLDVHVEQAPEASYLFDPHDPAQLAALYIENISTCLTRDKVACEQKAAQESRKLVQRYAETFLTIAQKYSQDQDQGQSERSIMNTRDELLPIESMIKAGNNEDAVNTLMPIVRGNPNDIDAYYLLIICFWNLGSYEKAQTMLSMALDMAANHEGLIYLKNKVALATIDKSKIALPETTVLPSVLGHHEENLPKISIVVPSYNQGRYLDKCLSSIFSQNYPNLECCVIDGGSTDESVAVIKKYDDKLTFWVSENDRGQSHAINKGLERSTGDIWAWLNSDDWYEPGALFKVAETYKCNPEASAWVGACYRLHDNGWLHYISYPNGLTREHLGNNWNCRQFYQPSCFFNRKYVQEVGGLKEALHFTMDIDLYLRVLERGPFVQGEGIWSTALAQTDAKTVKQIGEAFAEHAELDRSYGFIRGAQNIEEKIKSQYKYSNYAVPDSVLDALALLSSEFDVQAPFEFYTRSHLYFIGDFSNKENVQESIRWIKALVSVLFERIHNPVLHVCGAGVTAVSSLAQPNQVILSERTDLSNLKQVNSVVISPHTYSLEWLDANRTPLTHAGVPIHFCGLQGSYTNYVNGENAFLGKEPDELAFKVMLCMLEPSTYGNFSAMTLLNSGPQSTLGTEPTSVVQCQEANNQKRVHVFIYCWNNESKIKDALESLRTTQYTNYKLFLLNNGSSDQTGSVMDRVKDESWFNECEVIHLPINIGAPAARNWLAALPENQDADFIAYFDDDILVKPDWLEKMLETLERYPQAGVVGAKILNSGTPKVIQHSGGVLTQSADWINRVILSGSVEDTGQFDSVSERDYLMGCANVYRKDAFYDTGYFDLQFAPTQFDDVDHHLRMRLKGYQVIFDGRVEIVHLRNSGGPVNANHIANRYKLENKYSVEDAQKIIDQGALKDFSAKHPWAIPQ
ncbi:MAG: glycosyltransferase [Fibrobacterales bacterium]